MKHEELAKRRKRKQSIEIQKLVPKIETENPNASTARRTKQERVKKAGDKYTMDLSKIYKILTFLKKYIIGLSCSAKIARLYLDTNETLNTASLSHQCQDSHLKILEDQANILQEC